jgi:hypothetical protein
MPRRIRCDYEGQLFSRDDFDETPEYGLVHSRNLNKAPRHTKTGLVINDDGSWKGSGGGGGGWHAAPGPPPHDFS